MFDSKFLYVGCGAHQIEGFIHADISVYKLSKITEIEKKKIDIICDITDNIPLPNNSLEVIFSRDTLEHLTWKELINHFLECHRLLIDGGIIRLTVPNFDKMIEKYRNQNENLADAIKNSEVSTSISPIENHTDLFINRVLYHDHYYLHNFDTMKRALEKCGFGDTKEVKPGETSISSLKNIFFEAENNIDGLSIHIESKKIKLPNIKKFEKKFPKNFIKKILVILFNINITPFIKRKPMFPNSKWFFEKYLMVKQFFGFK